MDRKAGRGKPKGRTEERHTITWEQFRAFAKSSGRDLTHAFRVFKGERTSATLSAGFERHFGFPMKDAVLAGRRRAAA